MERATIVGPVVNTLPVQVCFDFDVFLGDKLTEICKLILRNGEHDWFPQAHLQDALESRNLFDMIVDVQREEEWVYTLAPNASAYFRELVDNVGTPMTISFLTRPDGTATLCVTSETSACDSQVRYCRV